MRINLPDQPKFKAGDRVVVVGPGAYRERRGVIAEVLRHSGDYVYRYRVRFTDGGNQQFFGFELAPAEAA